MLFILNRIAFTKIDTLPVRFKWSFLGPCWVSTSLSRLVYFSSNLQNQNC